MANGNGGKRPGAGRKKGVPQRLTPQQLAEAAQWHAEAVIERIAGFAGILSEFDATALGIQYPVQFAALKELLDRGYGRANQPVDVDVSGQMNLNTSHIDAPPRPETWDEWHARWQRDLDEMAAATGTTGPRNQRLLNS